MPAVSSLLAGGVAAERMRRPRILDVLKAATRVAADFPHVRVWWYAPAATQRKHQGAAPGFERVPCEVVVDTDAAAADTDRLGQALMQELAGYPVCVRLFDGDARGLFRLLSRPSSPQPGTAAQLHRR